MIAYKMKFAIFVYVEDIIHLIRDYFSKWFLYFENLTQKYIDERKEFESEKVVKFEFKDMMYLKVLLNLKWKLKLIV